ncbi:MAG: PAS domain S-box protein [Peptococcaceae bacterium]|nr:PAS domain S-box protein [Peptococcaceae bacterium]
MTSKIFKSILSVAIAVLLASLVVITGMLYQYFGTMQESQLKDELSLAASATEQLGQSYLSQLDSDRYRLTWVDADGMVIFDTHADSATMDNHENREEIREALLTGTGSSVRQSSTLTEQTIYEAVRLEDGSVLRISVSRATAFVLVIGMFQPILMVLFFAAGLSAWLARRMAKRVVEPLNNLNLDQPMENEAYEELSPLLHRIHTQHIEIEQQMQELQHKRDEFDQITDNMKEALVLLDHSSRILSINPAAKNLYEIASVTIGEDFLTLERKQFMREALEQAKVQGHAEFRAQKNGRDYQFDVNRIDSDGNTHGMVILAYDITEQVNAEKHRQAFTANVSHELKTPLQAIIGSAELMENGIVKTDDLPRFVGHIRKEASRLLYLIDDIIRLSQLDEGAEMDQEDVPLKQLAEDVCETLTDAAKLKDVTLEVTGEDVVMRGVRRLLYEILYNLCDNAIKYNRAGGSVTVSVSQKTNEICVSVKDTGIGIPPEHQDKIFERFYRVDKSHSKQSGGTGLGLSIVKHAVQYHHGKIVLASQVNVGTTITVLFDTTV